MLYPKPQRQLLYVISVAIMFLYGCSAEQKLAINYQKEFPETPVLLRFNPEFYLTNSKIPIPEGLSEQENQAYYDTAFSKSDLIQYIDGNRFLIQFEENFTNSLAANKFHIYEVDSITTFLTQRKPALIIEIEQLEIEEYIILYNDYIDVDNQDYITTSLTGPIAKYEVEPVTIQVFYDGSKSYHAEINMNAISVNAWINITIIKEGGTQSHELLYMQFELSDEIEGDFVPYSLDYAEGAEYAFKRDSLNIKDLYSLQINSPQDFAQQITDYLINQVINDRLTMDNNRIKKREWYYSQKSGRILPVSEANSSIYNQNKIVEVGN